VPVLLDHVLAALLAILFPIWGSTLGVRRLKRAPLEDKSRVRLSVYRNAIILQWTLTAAVLAVWAANHRSWSLPPEGIGLVPVPTPGFLGVALGLAIVVFVLVRQRNQALRDDDALQRIRTQIRERQLEMMLPHTRQELTWFARLSVTAGVCEEIMYRGYLVWYLAHWFGIFQSAGLAALVFGIGHSYQGWRGMLLTAVVGAFFGAVYLVSGSLLLPMVIHALMDLHSGHISFVAIEREGEMRAREIEWADESGVSGHSYSETPSTSPAPEDDRLAPPPSTDPNAPIV
jgi:membrane protease YdiL (CAAX protease family)